MKRYLRRCVCGILILFIGSSVFAQDMDTVLSVPNRLNHSSLIKKAIAPTVLIAYGIASTYRLELRQFDRYVNNSTLGGHGYSGSADDYLRYGPIAIVYGLDLLGMKAKSNFIDRTAMLLLSTSLTSTVVTATKRGVARMRPDLSGFTSFPSSHTAMAFMSAEFMNQELKDQSVYTVSLVMQPLQLQVYYDYIITCIGLATW